MAASPWNKIKPIEEPQSLQEIMSEEIARDMQHKEEQKLAEFISSDPNENESTATAEISAEVLAQLGENQEYCDSDAVIAKVLQMQFDREYNAMLKKTEQKFNGTSKVNVSFSNYRREKNRLNSGGQYCDEEDDDSEDDDYGNQNDNGEEKKDWDRFAAVEREYNAIPPCGYKRSPEGGMITKHDITISGRRNACKVMAFPPEFQTGDGAGFDMRLPNKVFNSLKAHSRTEQARRHKMNDKREDHATATMGVDTKTRLILYKLVSSIQLIQQINGVISTGKEAMIVHCDSDPSYPERTLPKECAIKIFKTTLNEFKTRDKYIQDDQRFKDRFGKQNPRKMMHLWAEKEMNNLMRMAKIGIPCPEVVFLRHHVLVMSFIGYNNMAAKKLKDAALSFEDLCDAHDQVVDTVRKLYQEAHLVHADLSEYNILWYDDKCWFIDVSQAVEYEHPSAYEFLLRDLTNIYTFFSKKGIPNVRTPDEMFQDIVDETPEEAIKSQRKEKKMKPHLVDRPDVEQLQQNFDRLWENHADKPTIAINLQTANTDLPSASLVEAPKA